MVVVVVVVVVVVAVVVVVEVVVAEVVKVVAVKVVIVESSINLFWRLSRAITVKLRQMMWYMIVLTTRSHR